MHRRAGATLEEVNDRKDLLAVDQRRVGIVRDSDGGWKDAAAQPPG